MPDIQELSWHAETLLSNRFSNIFLYPNSSFYSSRDNESTNVSQNLKGCSETDVNIEVELRSSLPPEVDVFQDFSEPIRPQATPLYLRNKDVDSIEAMNKFTLSLSTFPISATGLWECTKEKIVI